MLATCFAVAAPRGYAANGFILLRRCCMTLASLAPTARHVKKIGLCRTAFFVLILFAASVVAASGQTFVNIKNLNGYNGFPSYMAPVQGRDGNFYGTAGGGFRSDNG